MEITEEMKNIVRLINSMIDKGECIVPDYRKYAGFDVNTLNYEIVKLIENAMEEEEPIRL